MMRAHLALPLLLLALAACAAEERWVRPAADEAANQRDYAACQQQAYVVGQREFGAATFPPRPGGETFRGANPLAAPMDRFGEPIGSDINSPHRLEWRAARDRAYAEQRRALRQCLAAAGFTPVPAAE